MSRFLNDEILKNKIVLWSIKQTRKDRQEKIYVVKQNHKKKKSRRENNHKIKQKNETKIEKTIIILNDE